MLKFDESWQLSVNDHSDSTQDDDGTYLDNDFEENEDYFYEHDFNINKDKREL